MYGTDSKAVPSLRSARALAAAPRLANEYSSAAPISTQLPYFRLLPLSMRPYSVGLGIRLKISRLG